MNANYTNMNKLYSKPDLKDRGTKVFCLMNKYCGEHLTDAINRHYSGYSLDTESVLSDVLAVHSPERIAYVLAVRVYGNNGFDGRFSRDNEEWANDILKNVDNTFKDKLKSPIRYEIDYLTSHNGLADMVMTDFRKAFPDVTLEPDERPLTAKLKPMKNGALANLEKPSFDTDFDEFKEKAYLCIEMEYPDKNTAWSFMKRADLDKSYISDTLLDKNESKNCYVDVYEDGEILLIVSGNSVEITEDESAALKDILNRYTKSRFGFTLKQTVLKAINGEKPSVKTCGLEK